MISGEQKTRGEGGVQDRFVQNWFVQDTFDAGEAPSRPELHGANQTQS
jgi:hypothetical protein